MQRSYDFLFWAYNVVWIALVAYGSFLAVRLARVSRRLERLEKRIAGDKGGSGS